MQRPLLSHRASRSLGAQTGLLEGGAAAELANQVVEQLLLRLKQGALLPNFAAELIKVAASEASLLSESLQQRRQ